MSLERAVLAALLCHPEEAAHLQMEPEVFTDLKNREVYRAMRALARKKRPVNDLALLEEEIGPKLPAIGGIAYLSESLSDGWEFVRENLPEYVEELQEKRRQQNLRTKLAEIIAGNGDDIPQQIQQAILENTKPKRSISTFGDLWIEAIKDLDKPASEHMVKSGFSLLDEKMGGLPIGSVTIVAGRPSTGKSSLARQIAIRIAYRGEGVHYFSLEDSRLFFMHRCMSELARVGLQPLHTKKLSKQDIQSIAAVEKMPEHFIIDDRRGITASDISNEVMFRREPNKTKLVVIDYIQLMTNAGDGESKRVKLENECDRLCVMARENGVACILVSQLNRDNAKEQRAPRLSDLRETGALEQIADSVIMIHPDRRDDDEPQEEIPVQVILGKNKHGPIGSLDMTFLPRYTCFR